MTVMDRNDYIALQDSADYQQTIRKYSPSDIANPANIPNPEDRELFLVYENRIEALNQMKTEGHDVSEALKTLYKNICKTGIRKNGIVNPEKQDRKNILKNSIENLMQEDLSDLVETQITQRKPQTKSSEVMQKNFYAAADADDAPVTDSESFGPIRMYIDSIFTDPETLKNDNPELDRMVQSAADNESRDYNAVFEQKRKELVLAAKKADTKGENLRNFINSLSTYFGTADDQPADAPTDTPAPAEQAKEQQERPLLKPVDESQILSEQAKEAEENAKKAAKLAKEAEENAKKASERKKENELERQNKEEDNKTVSPRRSRKKVSQQNRKYEAQIQNLQEQIQKLTEAQRTYDQKLEKYDVEHKKLKTENQRLAGDLSEVQRERDTYKNDIKEAENSKNNAIKTAQQAQKTAQEEIANLASLVQDAIIQQSQQSTPQQPKKMGWSKAALAAAALAIGAIGGYVGSYLHKGEAPDGKATVVAKLSEQDKSQIGNIVNKNIESVTKEVKSVEAKVGKNVNTALNGIGGKLNQTAKDIKIGTAAIGKHDEDIKGILNEVYAAVGETNTLIKKSEDEHKILGRKIGAVQSEISRKLDESLGHEGRNQPDSQITTKPSNTQTDVRTQPADPLMPNVPDTSNMANTQETTQDVKPKTSIKMTYERASMLDLNADAKRMLGQAAHFADQSTNKQSVFTRNESRAAEFYLLSEVLGMIKDDNKTLTGITALYDTRFAGMKEKVKAEIPNFADFGADYSTLADKVNIEALDLGKKVVVNRIAYTHLLYAERKLREAQAAYKAKDKKKAAKLASEAIVNAEIASRCYQDNIVKDAALILGAAGKHVSRKQYSEAIKQADKIVPAEVRKETSPGRRRARKFGRMLVDLLPFTTLRRYDLRVGNANRQAYSNVIGVTPEEEPEINVDYGRMNTTYGVLEQVALGHMHESQEILNSIRKNKKAALNNIIEGHYHAQTASVFHKANSQDSEYTLSKKHVEVYEKLARKAGMNVNVLRERSIIEMVDDHAKLGHFQVRKVREGNRRILMFELAKGIVYSIVLPEAFETPEGSSGPAPIIGGGRTGGTITN